MRRGIASPTSRQVCDVTQSVSVLMGGVGMLPISEEVNTRGGERGYLNASRVYTRLNSLSLLAKVTHRSDML